MVSDLIYDVGLHNGNDTAYYLNKGFRVVAIEANPVLAAQAQSRFAEEIGAGRLTILCVGIAESEGSLPFWVNEHNDTWSSFDKTLGCRDGTPCHKIQVPTMPMSQIISQHGVPYYLKVDIEGHDRFCVQGLNRADLPKYISLELSESDDSVTLLRLVGYKSFKVINQSTFTDSGQLFPDEIGLRALRKLYTRSMVVKRLVWQLPPGIRPKRVDFDNFPLRLGYAFKEGSSGPFGEETYGPWHSFDELMKKLARIQRRVHAKNRRSLATCWYDIHATR